MLVLKHVSPNGNRSTETLTSLRCPDCDHLVGLVHLAETLGEHLDLVSGVWFQHSQFVAGFVAVSVHIGPLLNAHKPGDKNARSVM